MAPAAGTKADDPRRAKAVVDFKFSSIPKDELPFDMYAFMGLWFALGAVLLHVRVYSWLNMLCLFASLANTRFSNVEFTLMSSQIVMAGLTFVATHGGAAGGGVIFPFLAKKAQGAAGKFEL